MRYLPLSIVALAVLLASATASAAVPAVCADPVSTAAGAGLDEIAPPFSRPREQVCIFICEPWFQTVTYWGIGPDCNSSRSNLISQVGAEASSTGPGLCSGAGAAFGYCGYNLVITGACHWDAGHAAYVTDGHGDIKCKDYC